MSTTHSGHGDPRLPWEWVVTLHGCDSFIVALQELLNLQVTYRNLSTCDRTPPHLVRAQSEVLHLEGSERLQVRTGELLHHTAVGSSAARVLALVESVVVLSRLDREDEQHLREGVALGMVLAPHGVWRHVRDLRRLPEGHAQVEALLTVRGVPVATTREVVPRDVLPLAVSPAPGATT